MRSLAETMYMLSNDLNFLSFQKKLAQKMYSALRKGYINNENEVSLVTSLVDSIDGEKYKSGRLNINIHSNKIHGTRSLVEFKYQNKLTTKELADMLVIIVLCK